MHYRLTIILLISIALNLFALPASFAGSASYTYDAQYRLKTITYDDGTVIEYSYDKVGNRTMKKVTNPNVINTLLTSYPANISHDNYATFEFASSQAGATFECMINAGNYFSCSSPYTFNNLGNGNYIFKVRAKDINGNPDASPAIYNWQIYNSSTITTSTGEGGSISPVSPTVIYSGSQSFTIAPTTGYHIVEVKVDGVSKGVITSHTFTDVIADHTLEAYFAVNSYSVSTIIGDGGTISPSSATVYYGNSQTFTITPDTGLKVLDVKVDGISQGPVTNYTFISVTAPHTIEATFGISGCANRNLSMTLRHLPSEFSVSCLSSLPSLAG